MAKTIVSGDFGGNITPRGVLDDLLDRAEDYEMVVVIALSKEEGGDIAVGHSSGDYLTKLGLCETAKDHFLYKMRTV